MIVFAITQPTASWLLAKTDICDALSENLQVLSDCTSLRKSVFLLGPLRIAATEDGSVVALWHSDYLNSTGVESWGFIRLSGRFGAFGSGLVPDVFKTSMVIFDARLQNLLLPARQLVRPHGHSVSTCVLGIGKAKKNASLGYLESNSADMRSVYVIGPAQEEGNLEKSLATLAETLMSLQDYVSSLAFQSNTLLVQARRRPATDDKQLTALRQIIEEGRLSTYRAEIYQPELTQTYHYSTDKTYDQWISADSELSPEKKAILAGDYLDSQPLRIIGPAGSGKSLLMQLMAIRMAKRAQTRNHHCKILYVVHNSACMAAAIERLETLWPVTDRPCDIVIDVLTLVEYCRKELGVETGELLDNEASETKNYQFLIVSEALQSEISGLDEKYYPLFSQAQGREELFAAIVALTISDIGVVIKGHQLQDEPRKYIEAERPLSRFHSLITPEEREIVMNVYSSYNRQVSEEAGLLDTDDLAISTLSRLRTPVWSLRRRSIGYDYVFVDEAQLYNENERRIFAYLTKQVSGHLPIAIALDEAQNLTSSVVSGFGVLGLESLRDEALNAVYRSTRAILRLAFHVIQRTTDLFGPEFPDFTAVSQSILSDCHPHSGLPCLIESVDDDLSATVLKVVLELRKKNLRQIGVVVHSDRYFQKVLDRLTSANQPVCHITQRGQKLDATMPLIAVSLPRLIGGQEFDAVVAVGIENGLVPPRVHVDGLAASLEQQALRELYLSFTRARLRVVIVNSKGSSPSTLLSSAIQDGLLIKQDSV